MANLRDRGDGLFSVEGDLDFSSVTPVLNQYRQLLGGQRSMVLDFSAVERSNSAALALLLQLLSDARAAGRELRFRGIPDSLLDLARMSNVDGLLAAAQT